MKAYRKLAAHKNVPDDYKRAKELRNQAPIAEQILWHKLRNLSSSEDIRFRRQHPINPYIVDFICLKAKLVIEVDGPSHNIRQTQDQDRDIYIKNLGYTIMRFSNDEILKNSDGVVITILNKAKQLYVPLPQPLPQGEGSKDISRRRGHD